jgi:hypothetical protein
MIVHLSHFLLYFDPNAACCFATRDTALAMGGNTCLHALPLSGLTSHSLAEEGHVPATMRPPPLLVTSTSISCHDLQDWTPQTASCTYDPWPSSHEGVGVICVSSILHFQLKGDQPGSILPQIVPIAAQVTRCCKTPSTAYNDACNCTHCPGRLNGCAHASLARCCCCEE